MADPTARIFILSQLNCFNDDDGYNFFLNVRCKMHEKIFYKSVLGYGT